MTTNSNTAPTVPTNATTKTALTALAMFFDERHQARKELADQCRLDDEAMYPEQQAIADTLHHAANTTWELIGGRPNDSTSTYELREHFVKISAKELGKLVEMADHTSLHGVLDAADVPDYTGVRENDRPMHLDERIFALIEQRDNAMAPKIVATNAELDRLRKRLELTDKEYEGVREALQQGSIPVVVDGKELTTAERVRWLVSDAEDTMQKWEQDAASLRARIADLESRAPANECSDAKSTQYETTIELQRARIAELTDESFVTSEVERLKEKADNLLHEKLRLEGRLAELEAMRSASDSLLSVGESCWPRIAARRVHLIIRDLERGLAPAESVELYTLERVRRARSELASSLLTLRMGTLDEVAEVLGSVVQSVAWTEQEQGLMGTGLAEELEAAVDDRRQALAERAADGTLTEEGRERLARLNAASRRMFVNHFAMRDPERIAHHGASISHVGCIRCNGSGWDETLGTMGGACVVPEFSAAPTPGRMFLGVTFERELADGSRETIDPSEVRIMVGNDPTPLALVGKTGPR